MSLPDWSRAHGPALFSAVIRSEPSEFEVSEELGFGFSADGEHDYLFVEKTGANTEWVSRQLAAHAAVASKDVGYAGLKDRHSVSRQWFSIPRWNAPDWTHFAADGVRVLEVRRHHRKLRRGAHQGNRFRIVLRGAVPQGGELDERLATISREGVPNYFGEQRFGRGGSNIALANAWADGRRLGRHKRSLAISTVRSFLFNEFLDARVRDGNWDKLIDGDVANLDGSQSVFPVDTVDDDLLRRCEQMDLHPAGPLYGDDSPKGGIAAGREGWLDALARARVKPAHRSLRLRVANLEWEARPSAIVVEFALCRGAFATAVLREVADVASANQPAPTSHAL